MTDGASRCERWGERDCGGWGEGDCESEDDEVTYGNENLHDEGLRDAEVADVELCVKDRAGMEMDAMLGAIQNFYEGMGTRPEINSSS